MDSLSSEARSKLMSLVKSKHTKPELRIRKALHSRGIRYRLHAHGLPGSPDIVFKKFTTVIFIHGCFWHRHAGCKKARVPKSNTDFWSNKFLKNVARDKIIANKYREMGWNVVIIWECETETQASLDASIEKILGALGK